MQERQKPTRRDDYCEFLSHDTRWHDNDSYGHLNNTVHYGLFDTAVNSWLIRNDILNAGDTKLIALVAQSGCTYHSEIIFPDTVHIGLRLGHMGTSSVRYELGIFRNDQETSSADGFFVHVFVDALERKPKAIPNQARSILNVLLE